MNGQTVVACKAKGRDAAAAASRWLVSLLVLLVVSCSHFLATTPLYLVLLKHYLVVLHLPTPPRSLSAPPSSPHPPFR